MILHFRLPCLAIISPHRHAGFQGHRLQLGAPCSHPYPAKTCRGRGRCLRERAGVRAFRAPAVAVSIRGGRAGRAVCRAKFRPSRAWAPWGSYTYSVPEGRYSYTCSMLCYRSDPPGPRHVAQRSARVRVRVVGGSAQRRGGVGSRSRIATLTPPWGSARWPTIPLDGVEVTIQARHGDSGMRTADVGGAWLLLAVGILSVATGCATSGPAPFGLAGGDPGAVAARYQGVGEDGSRREHVDFFDPWLERDIERQAMGPMW